MTNRITHYIPRAVDSPSDTGYGSEAAFRESLAKSDSLAPLSEADQRWLRDIDAAYWRGVADGRRAELVPIDAGGVGILWCCLFAGLALWGVTRLVHFLAGW